MGFGESLMSKRSDYDHDKRELFVVICDIYSVTVNQVMMANANDEFNLYIANRNPWFSNNPLLKKS